MKEGVITAKMRKQFWKYNLNPITGLPKITITCKKVDVPSFSHPNDAFVKLHA